MDNSEAVKVCRATAFAASFALQAHARLDSGLGPPESDGVWEAYADEAQAVADAAAKQYARVLNPGPAKTEDRSGLPEAHR